LIDSLACANFSTAGREALKKPSNSMPNIDDEMTAELIKLLVEKNNALKQKLADYKDELKAAKETEKDVAVKNIQKDIKLSREGRS